MIARAPGHAVDHARAARLPNARRARPARAPIPLPTAFPRTSRLGGGEPRGGEPRAFLHREYRFERAMNDGAYALGPSCIGSAVSPCHKHNSRKPPLIAGAFSRPCAISRLSPIGAWGRVGGPLASGVPFLRVISTTLESPRSSRGLFRVHAQFRACPRLAPGGGLVGRGNLKTRVCRPAERRRSVGGAW